MNGWTNAVAVSLLVAAGWSAAAAEPVTFYGQVAPLVHEHCACCHRPGGAGPFALITARDVASQADKIREAVSQGEMPPWKVVGSRGEFSGDRRLSEDQKRLLLRWIAEGCPEGTRVPLQAPQAATDAWQLGEPAIVLRPQRLGTRGPAGVLVAELEETDDALVAAIEVRPRQAGFGHVLLWLDLPISAQVLEVDNAGHEVRSQFLPSWLRDRLLAPAPSAFRPAERAAAVAARDRRLLGVWAGDCLAQALPENTAIRFPTGSRLIVETSATDDAPASPLEIGLHLAKSPPQRLAAVVAVESTTPHGTGQREVSRQGSFQTPVDCELHLLAPHADAACREVRVSLTLPSGRSESLLWIDHWDERWETAYQYRRPSQVPARSRIDVQFLTAVERGWPRLSGGPALVAAQLVPVQAGDYDELVRAMQRTQMNVARQPVKAGRVLR